MGQYQKAVFLKDNKTTVENFISPWDYDNGAKLMEHSYITNFYMSAVETVLYKKPQRVVWAGDYADNCKRRKSNVYDRCIDSKEIKPAINVNETQTRFIINQSKKLFVDKTKIPKGRWDYKIHPLSLLTCESNGQGGGDYGGEDSNNIIGTWARDLIYVDDKAPIDYKEIEFNLVEK